MKIEGQCYYVHKTNLDEFSKVMSPEDIKWIKCKMIELRSSGISYEVLKYNKPKRTVSFIESPDWNTAKEPVVGDSHQFGIDTGSYQLTRGRKSNKQIYHNKEVFVSPDYTGFDIEAAKHRTAEWNALPVFKKNSGRIKSLIGNQKYWFDLLDEYGLEH